MAKSDISIVVTTYNRADMLRDALGTLVCQETDRRFTYEIVVIDNASTDHTPAVVEEVAAAHPELPVRYAYEGTPGQAYAMNTGVREAAGAWVAFFDDDELAEPAWLMEMYGLAIDKGVPIVGCALDLQLPEETLGEIGRYGRMALREKIEPAAFRYEPGNVPGSFQRKTPGGYGVLIARPVFDTVGLFDTSMVRGSYDSDFFFRAREAGYEMWYTPKAVVHHRIPASRLTPEFFRWDARQTGENFAFLDYKYAGKGRMCQYCILRIGQALLLNLPRLVLAWARRDRGEMLSRKILLWRATAYARRTLSLVAPRIFPQKAFLDSLDFRKGSRSAGRAEPQADANAAAEAHASDDS